MILRTKKEKLVMNERNIMANCKNPFVIELKYAFEAEKYLAFVMEYCSGGELFGLIKKYRRLSEEKAKFYTNKKIKTYKSIDKLLIQKYTNS